MSDIRVRRVPQNDWVDVPGDSDGRVLVADGGRTIRFSASGAAGISLATTMKDKAKGRSWRLKHVAATFSTAPTTSESLTVTQNPGGEFGKRPSTVVFSNDPSASAATSVMHVFDAGALRMEQGDEVTLAYTNTDTRTVVAEIVCEVL